VLGFRTVSRDHRDSYVFDVIYGVLGRPQSGWIFEEIRNKKGLSYQAGVQNDIEQSYGTIAAFAGLDKKNIKQAKEIILRQFDKLKRLSIGELNISKTFLEGHRALELEDTFRRADELAGWEFVRDAKIFDDYIRNIQEVTVQDVRRVAKKFFNDNYTLVAIEQK
jgi:zinc protease